MSVLEITGMPSDYDKHNNILIIGKAGNNYMLNKITYSMNAKEVLAAYQDSNLYQAFLLAKTIGAPNIFLMNVQYEFDYIKNVAPTLQLYDFAYVCFTDLYLSASFYDATEEYKKLYYGEFFLEQMNNYNDTIFAFTDKPASLYETVDDYIDSMQVIIDAFKATITSNVSPQNLCFIGNNLTAHNLANVAAIAALCAASLPEYPLYNFGPAVFNIDNSDLGLYEMSYFRNNFLTNTTIENFINFSATVSPEKIMETARIINYIKRELDFSEYEGKPY